jgi:hypothetical protein
MARFQIITDTTTYTHGDTTDAFAALGHKEAVLEDYKPVGDWIDLFYSGGFELSIPEARVKYIAKAPAA